MIYTGTPTIYWLVKPYCWDPNWSNTKIRTRNCTLTVEIKIIYMPLQFKRELYGNLTKNPHKQELYGKLT